MRNVTNLPKPLFIKRGLFSPLDKGDTAKPRGFENNFTGFMYGSKIQLVKIRIILVMTLYTR